MSDLCCRDSADEAECDSGVAKGDSAMWGRHDAGGSCVDVDATARRYSDESEMS